MSQASEPAKTFTEVVKPYVVAVVTTSTAAALLAILFGLGEVVLLAFALMGAAAIVSPGTAKETLSDCLPAFGKTAILTGPVAVVLVGAFVLLGGVLIDRSWVMIAGASVATAGTILTNYCLRKVGPRNVYSAFFFLVMFRFPGPIHPTRRFVRWGDRWVLAKDADERCYRIDGLPGTGKTWLTLLFILEALQELKKNPYAKLICFEPKREMYAWLKSMKIPFPVHYWMPSDERGVAQDLGRDYPTPQDKKTYAYAFFPHEANEHQRFWGDAVRAIFHAVHSIIHEKLGYVTLRLILAVLESEEDTMNLIGGDFEHDVVKVLVGANVGDIGDVQANIRATIATRVGEMKTIASHLDQAAKERDPFSLNDFLTTKNSGILVVSKDETHNLTHDPMNSMLFKRLVQLMDSMEPDPQRKVFLVIDEFPTLAGQKPCENIVNAFERLRSRGAVILITYQLYESLVRVYGATDAAAIVKMCQSSVYDLQPATPKTGIRGRAKTSVPRSWWKFVGMKSPWDFRLPPRFANKDIPKWNEDIERYSKRDSSSQKMQALTKSERANLGLPPKY